MAPQLNWNLFCFQLVWEIKGSFFLQVEIMHYDGIINSLYFHFRPLIRFVQMLTNWQILVLVVIFLNTAWCPSLGPLDYLEFGMPSIHFTLFQFQHYYQTLLWLDLIQIYWLMLFIMLLKTFRILTMIRKINKFMIK